MWWVLIKPKPREGRSAGLGVQGEWECCRFGGRSLPRWRSEGTEAKTATCQQIDFSLTLKDDRKLFDFDSADLNEKVGVEGTAAREAWWWLSSDANWVQPLWAALCSWLCGCSSTAASPTSISASSLSSTLDVCSCLVNTRGIQPFQIEWPFRTRTNGIHKAHFSVLWLKIPKWIPRIWFPIDMLWVKK